MNKNYQDINAETIDRWIEEGWEWGKPVNHETYINAKNGKWNVLLTPVKSVPHEWFGEMKGKKLLGLASGGGQQIPIFSALGAECTVLDYSDRQLKSEEEGMLPYSEKRRNSVVRFGYRDKLYCGYKGRKDN